jgi:hypothetical protein
LGEAGLVDNPTDLDVFALRIRKEDDLSDDELFSLLPKGFIFARRTSFSRSPFDRDEGISESRGRIHLNYNNKVKRRGIIGMIFGVNTTLGPTNKQSDVFSLTSLPSTANCDLVTETVVNKDGLIVHIQLAILCAIRASFSLQ